MKRRIIFLGLVLSFLVGNVSCEKVIEIEVEDSEVLVVVEGVLNDRVGESFIRLSKTGDVYGANEFIAVSDAVVTIADQSGAVYTFDESPVDPGYYILPTFATSPNDFYSLNIISEGITYTSSCETFYKPSIDTMTYLEQIGGFGPEIDTNYLVFYNFVDKANEINHYRVKVWVNGSPDDVYYVLNDDLIDGQFSSAPFFATEIKPRDTVFVEMQSMDQANYTYLVTLSSNADSGPFSAAPANPVSNIEGGGIGYFGAFTTDTVTIVMPG